MFCARYPLALEAGTTTALLGRSGSGKTTLLRTVNALVRPTSGDVLVNGRSIGALKTEKELVALRRGIGYVIQETGLFPHMTVERNASLALNWKVGLKRRWPHERDKPSQWLVSISTRFATVTRGSFPADRGSGLGWLEHSRLIRQYC